MNATDIKLVMTPKEWERRRTWRGHMSTGEMVGSVQDDQATAALLLHGQPFGFTWADADALREDATEWRERSDIFEGRWLRLEELANRIAALLPPRE